MNGKHKKTLGSFAVVMLVITCSFCFQPKVADASILSSIQDFFSNLFGKKETTVIQVPVKDRNIPPAQTTSELPPATSSAKATEVNEGTSPVSTAVTNTSTTKVVTVQAPAQVIREVSTQYISSGVTQEALNNQLLGLKNDLQQQIVNSSSNNSSTNGGYTVPPNLFIAPPDLSTLKPTTLSVSGASSFMDALFNGAITLASTTPTDATSKLYNNAGSLYWNGSLVAGAAVGNWTSSGANVYRATGNVGIGTNNPLSKLEVVSNDNLGDTGIKVFSNNKAQNLSLGWSGITTTSGGLSFKSSNGTAQFQNSAGFNTMTLDAAGALQLGTGVSGSNGAVIISKNDGAGGSRSASLKYNSTFDFGIFDSGSTMQFGVNFQAPANSLYVNSSGNVGVGTSTPSAKLSVAGDMLTSGDITVQGNDLNFGVRSGQTFRPWINHDAANGNFDIEYNGQQSGNTNSMAGTMFRQNTSGFQFFTKPGDGSSLSPKVTINATTGNSPIFSVIGNKYAPLQGYQAQAQFISTDTFGAGVGGGIILGGTYTPGGTQSAFAQLVGAKENATDGNTAGALLFSTRVNNGNLVENMRISSTGNVGIGTAAPTNKLDVSGSAVFGSTYAGNATAAPANGVAIEGSLGLGTLAPLNKLDVNGGAVIGSSYAGVRTAPPNGLLVQGLVGIGDTAPASMLSVVGNATIGYSSGQTGPSNGLIVNGNVGIGTTNPAYKLEISGGDLNLAAGQAYRYNGQAIVTASTTLGNYFFGPAGNTSMTGAYNTAVGGSALQSNTTGYYNNAFGNRALVNNTTGTANNAVGYNALANNTSGESNSAFGHSVLANNTTGAYNAAFGLFTLLSNTTGSGNAVLGAQSLQNNTIGDDNIAIGRVALYNNATSSYNIGIGYASLYNNLGEGNVAIGLNAGRYNTYGNHNFFGGYQAGYTNTTGSNLTLIGPGADVGSTGLTNATAIGYGALVNASNSLVLGNGVNVGIGTTSPSSKLSVAGDALITGNISSPGTGPSSEKFGQGATASGQYGTAIGISAVASGSLFPTALGIGATASGNYSTALGSLTTASAPFTIAIGQGSLASADSSITLLGNATHFNSIVFGRGAQSTDTNQFVAGATSYSIDNVYFGKGALATSPTNYTINGTGGSGTDIAGANLTVAGGKATGNATGGALVFSTSDVGSSGTTLQSLSEKMRITPNGNVGIGTTSPSYKLHIYTNSNSSPDLLRLQNDGNAGSKISLFQAQNGEVGYLQNTFRLDSIVGFTTAINSSQYLTLQTAGTDRLTINTTGNVGIGTSNPGYKLTVNGEPAANGYTAFTNYSDARLKTNINTLGDSYLDKIMQLKPSTFNYNSLSGYDQETRNRTITGFVAQDLQQVFPNMVGTTTINGTEYLDTNLSALPIYLVKAIQELNLKVSNLQGSTTASSSLQIVDHSGILDFLKTAVLSVKEIIADKITTKNLAVENGVTIKGKDGNQYCIIVDAQGVMKNVLGTCENQDQTNSHASTPSSPTPSPIPDTLAPLPPANESTATTSPATSDVLITDTVINNTSPSLQPTASSTTP